MNPVSIFFNVECGLSKQYSQELAGRCCGVYEIENVQQLAKAIENDSARFFLDFNINKQNERVITNKVKHLFEYRHLMECGVQQVMQLLKLTGYGGMRFKCAVHGSTLAAVTCVAHLKELLDDTIEVVHASCAGLVEMVHHWNDFGVHRDLIATISPVTQQPGEPAAQHRKISTTILNEVSLVHPADHEAVATSPANTQETPTVTISTAVTTPTMDTGATKIYASPTTVTDAELVSELALMPPSLAETAEITTKAITDVTTEVTTEATTEVTTEATAEVTTAESGEVIDAIGEAKGSALLSGGDVDSTGDREAEPFAGEQVLEPRYSSNSSSESELSVQSGPTGDDQSAAAGVEATAIDAVPQTSATEVDATCLPQSVSEPTHEAQEALPTLAAHPKQIEEELEEGEERENSLVEDPPPFIKIEVTSESRQLGDAPATESRPIFPLPNQLQVPQQHQPQHGSAHSVHSDMLSEDQSRRSSRGKQQAEHTTSSLQAGRVQDQLSVRSCVSVRVSEKKKRKASCEVSDSDGSEQSDPKVQPSAARPKKIKKERVQTVAPPYAELQSRMEQVIHALDVGKLTLEEYMAMDVSAHIPDLLAISRDEDVLHGVLRILLHVTEWGRQHGPGWKYLRRTHAVERLVEFVLPVKFSTSLLREVALEVLVRIARVATWSDTAGVSSSGGKRSSNCNGALLKTNLVECLVQSYGLDSSEVCHHKTWHVLTMLTHFKPCATPKETKQIMLLAHNTLNSVPPTKDAYNVLYHLCECVEGVSMHQPALAMQEPFHLMAHLKVLLVRPLPWLSINITVMSILAFVAEWKAETVFTLLKENETIAPFIASLLQAKENENQSFYPLNEVIRLVTHLCAGVVKAHLQLLVSSGLLAVVLKKAAQHRGRAKSSVLAELSETLELCSANCETFGEWLQRMGVQSSKLA